MAMLLFGMSFVWTTDLLHLENPFPPQSLVLFRLSIACALLFVFLVASKRVQRVAARDVRWFVLLALFEPFIYFLGENYGLLITASAPLGSTILATVPVFTMLACFYAFGERPTWTNIAGVLFTIPGVALVVFTGRFTLNFPLSGILLLFLASLSTAGYAVVIRKLQHYSAFTIVVVQNLIGALYFVPMVLLLEREALAAVSWTWDVMYPLAMLSIFVSGCGFVLFVSAIKKIGVTQANMFSALIPLITALAAFLLGRKSMSNQQLIGMLVVVVGVVLSQYRSRN
jgi:drug/metabolite transporter (DMT)-like permease